MLIVDHATRAREHVALRSMFAARKRIFVDLLKQDLPVLADRYEIDHLDGPDATYLIVTDTEGEHLASARLLPTTGPASTGGPYRNLLPRPEFRGPDISELTHVCCTPDAGRRARRRARDGLLHGLVRHALGSGIRSFVGVADHGWIARATRLGCACRPLGAGGMCEGRALLAFAIDIDRGTPARLAAAGVADPGPVGRRPS